MRDQGDTRRTVEDVRRARHHALVPDDAPAPGRYRHFKGGEYEVQGVVRHSETEDVLVLYRPAGGAQLWVRPLAMFVEEVDGPDGRVPRFRPIGDGAEA